MSENPRKSPLRFSLILGTIVVVVYIAGYFILQNAVCPPPANVCASCKTLEKMWSLPYMSDEKSKNERLAELLNEHGDALEQARPVQHWAYFQTEASRAQFISFIERRFSDIAAYRNPISKGKEFAVTFWHTGTPDSDSMTEITESLSPAAETCGGEYDGWETQLLD